MSSVSAYSTNDWTVRKCAAFISLTKLQHFTTSGKLVPEVLVLTQQIHTDQMHVGAENCMNAEHYLDLNHFLLKWIKSFRPTITNI